MSSMAAIVEAGVAGGKCDWVAHASGMLVSASRRNELFLEGQFFENSQRFQKVRDREDALASTRDACATRKCAYASLRDINRRGHIFASWKDWIS
jgi:hypothetical protein